jgi:dTDP-4-dehydrorhamnose 3,5-epimerase
MSRFNVIPTRFDGLFVVRRKPISDERGMLARLYCAQEFSSLSIPLPVCQINHTVTRHKGSVRGLHFQHPPHAEIKLVSCLRGAVFDVAVDLRKHSPTFLQWHGQMLSIDEPISLYIPQGFAHGFQAMTDDCELVYLHSCEYHPESESGISAFDPVVSVPWPLTVTEVSDRDRKHPVITADFAGLEV